MGFSLIWVCSLDFKKLDHLISSLYDYYYYYYFVIVQKWLRAIMFIRFFESIFLSSVRFTHFITSYNVELHCFEINCLSRNITILIDEWERILMYIRLKLHLIRRFHTLLKEMKREKIKSNIHMFFFSQIWFKKVCLHHILGLGMLKFLFLFCWMHFLD